MVVVLVVDSEAAPEAVGAAVELSVVVVDEVVLGSAAGFSPPQATAARAIVESAKNAIICFIEKSSLRVRTYQVDQRSEPRARGTVHQARAFLRKDDHVPTARLAKTAI